MRDFPHAEVRGKRLEALPKAGHVKAASVFENVVTIIINAVAETNAVTINTELKP